MTDASKEIQMKVRVAVAGMAVLAVAGCGSAQAAKAAPTPTPTPQSSPTPSVRPPVGTAAFLADVRRVGLADKDVADAPDDSLVAIGNEACTVFSTGGMSYGQIVLAVEQGVPGMTAVQSENLVGSAVTNLCPEYRYEVPVQ